MSRSSVRGLQEVADGCHAYVQADGSWGWSNAGLVVGDGVSLLVDTLFDLKLTQRMLDSMQPVTLASPIAQVVNTHANGDHCFGNILLDNTEIIASTATAYAEAAFAEDIWNADALTVNPYLGADAVEPFIAEARKSTPQRGLFVLVRTSNPGGGLFQNALADGVPLYRRVGAAVADWNETGLGECGLGDVGAVVGATHPRELAELRAALPRVWFLVPGYGAQGGTAADVRAGFLPNGLGAVVNSSRGVVFPFAPDDADWEGKIVAAAKRAQAELRGTL